jgi:hypothetical protein
MPFSGPLPITDRQRRQHFNPAAITPTKHHHPVKKLRGMGEILKQASENRGGINLKSLKKMSGILRKESLFMRRGLDKTGVRIRQALLLDRMAAEYADNLVQRVKQRDMLVKMANAEKIPTEALKGLDAKSEKYGQELLKIEEELWGSAYSSATKHFFDKYKSNPVATEIGEHFAMARKYLTVPTRVHFERSQHWKSISRIVERLSKQEFNAEENLVLEVKRILGRKFDITQHSPIKNPYRLRAVDIIVAASIYADVVSRKKLSEKTPQTERTRFWDHAYSEAMERIYPLLEKDPGTLKQIISLK